MSHVRQFMVQQQTHAFSQGSRQHSSENTPLSQARLQPGYTALDSMAPSAQNLQLAEKFFIKQTQQTMYILFTQSWLRVVALGEVMRMPSSDRLSAPFQIYKTECLCLISGLQVYSRKMAVCGSLIRRGM